MHRKYLLGTSAMLAATLLAGVAMAQTAVATTPQEGGASSPQDITEVDEVLVQVNRRDENIQDVPAAVTAFTPEIRDELGVISIFDITRATPSFEYSSSIDRAFIRGIGRNTNAPGTQAGVALYIDGVYTPSTYGLDRPVIMSGATEIDSGPQGTLFGRNAIGGVIQQATAHATDEFETKIDFRYQDHNRIDAAMTVGGPINDNLKLLVGLDLRTQTEGYFYNVHLDKEVGGPTEEYLALAVLDYKIGNFDGFLKLESSGYDRYLSQFSQYGSTFTNRFPYFTDTGYSNFISVTPNFNCLTPANPAVPSRAAVNCPTNVAQATVYYDPSDIRAQNPYLLNNDRRTRYKSDGNGTIVNQTNWRLPWFDVKYIGGYTQYIYDNKQDYDNTARGSYQVDPDGPAGSLPAFTLHPTIYNYFEDRSWFSHELNFTSNDDGPLTWIYGLYYYRDDFINNTWINSPGQTELNTVAGVDNSRLDYFNTNGRAITKTYATFGQVDWEMSEQWKFTAGLRWNKDDVQTTESDHYYAWVPGNLALLANGANAFYNPLTGKYGPALNYSTTFVPGSCAPAGVPPVTASGATCSFDPLTHTRKIGNDWTGMGGTLSASYSPNDDTLIYLKYSRGYKAGGIAISGAFSVQPVMGSETLNAYELGYKWQPNRELTLNTNVFYYDYRDYQDFGNIPNIYGGNNALVSVGFNIPKARNIGLELNGSWHPTTQFTLSFSGNYMDAKVTDGGKVALPDSLDPLATGNVTVAYQDGTKQNITYTPQKCGPVVGAGANSYQAQCINGAALKGSAPWKLWVSPQYRFDFDAGSLDVIANYSVRAGNISSYSPNPIYEAPTYDSYDLRLMWTPDKGNYKVIAFMNNVTNNIGTEYVLAGRTTTLAGNAGAPENYIQNVFTIPRTWGLQFQATF